jgi:hypothetical protein
LTTRRDIFQGSCICPVLSLAAYGPRNHCRVGGRTDAPGTSHVRCSLAPNGKVLIINGAGTGISGYGNVVDQVGHSNADHPVLTPVLYDPTATAGQCFSYAGMKSSGIPRVYHSVASLTPNGDIMVAGSNPNLDRSELKHGTEYRVEWVGPPYMKRNRPVVHYPPKALTYGHNFTLNVDLPSTSKAKKIKGGFTITQFRPTKFMTRTFSGIDGSRFCNTRCSCE